MGCLIVDTYTREIIYTARFLVFFLVVERLRVALLRIFIRRIVLYCTWHVAFHQQQEDGTHGWFGIFFRRI